jgi:hypothetical protein
MKRLLLLFSIVLFLYGCPGATVGPSVIIKDQMLIPQPEAVFFTLPPQPTPLDTTTPLSQRDVALWITENEKRTLALEAMIINLQAIPTLVIEQGGLKEGDYKIVEIKKKADNTDGKTTPTTNK